MALSIIIVILALDQLTKFLISNSLALYQSKALIPGVIHFTLVHNKGAAFGILRNQVLFFIFTSLVAVVMLIKGLRDKQQPSKLYSVSLSLILAGALGNLIDRLFFGYVIDFIDLRVWPVFNIADSAITIGAILLGIELLKSEKKKP